jgi:hypothetical protein
MKSLSLVLVGLTITTLFSCNKEKTCDCTLDKSYPNNTSVNGVTSTTRTIDGSAECSDFTEYIDEPSLGVGYTLYTCVER